MGAAVQRLLRDEWPKKKNSSLLDTWRPRDEMMREIGPQMVVVHWKTLERLGRIPRSSEGECLTLSEAAAIAKTTGLCGGEEAWFDCTSPPKGGAALVICQRP